MQDEFSFIDKITPKRHFQSSLIQGIGDDAALFSGDKAFEEIICVDTMVEGVHFTRKTLNPYDIGYKALAVNMSDIAAMGGYPTYYLVSVAVPEDWHGALEETFRGMADLASDYRVDLIGGDTVSAKESLVITVTVLGRVEKGRHLLRSSAKPGDLAFVTGMLGNSAAGLSLLLQYDCNHSYSEQERQLIKTHQRPQPQIEAGRLLSSLSAKIALNDISDGIASEANEIAAASGVKLSLKCDNLPISKALRIFPPEKQREWMLYGGEDFQLFGTVPKEYAQPLQELFEKEQRPLAFIGTAKEGPAQVVLKQDGQTIRLEKKGFNHFNR